MLHPEDPLKLWPETQGSFDFGLRGCSIAKLCVGHSREAASDPEVRHVDLLVDRECLGVVPLPVLMEKIPVAIPAWMMRTEIDRPLR